MYYFYVDVLKLFTCYNETRSIVTIIKNYIIEKT